MKRQTDKNFSNNRRSKTSVLRSKHEIAGSITCRGDRILMEAEFYLYYLQDGVLGLTGCYQQFFSWPEKELMLATMVALSRIGKLLLIFVFVIW